MAVKGLKAIYRPTRFVCFVQRTRGAHIAYTIACIVAYTIAYIVAYTIAYIVAYTIAYIVAYTVGLWPLALSYSL